ncbi:NAD(P)H-dependent oxidoreductase [Streptomyces sp. NA04227]|uniref:NADPH-dependent FMN reductase n=1 Tax=Streptomyces sp. NA04227 TaxID=2742136 RepID=UPI001591072C|nr:NAD(P)H-dependent oxidoreductase [Streptomyces sp. NA04227]QKW06355.1 NAD(P)H-dependent oxidoreductase [Streptomyces sp. NA04227]
MNNTVAPEATLSTDVTTDPAAAAAPDSATPAPVRVALVLGSDREGRFGPTLAAWLLDRMDERTDVQVELIDVADAKLPTVLGSPTPEVSRSLSRVTPRLSGADAFLVLTPEYNHSYPAGLKGLIDRHFQEWQAKPVGFVSYGGISGGLRAVEHLRQVFAELHAVTVRDTVSFHHVHGQFDQDGNHLDPQAPEAALNRMLDQLVWWALALREAKKVRPYGS